MKASVFLIQLPLWAREPSLALAQLFAYLKREGFDVSLMDANIGLYHRNREEGAKLWSEEVNTIWGEETLPRDIMERHQAWIAAEYVSPICAAERPVAAFSVSACSIPASLIMARWIKQARPQVCVVFGGQIFTTTPSTVETALSSGVVDAVVSGDGEVVLADVAARVGEGRGLEGCPGLFVRGEGGRPLLTGDRALLDLDSLPFADYSAFDMSLYTGNHSGPHDLALMTNRGCVRRCSFCGHRTAWKGFRQMSGERVAAEIAHHRRTLPHLSHADSEIKFYDLLINGDMRKLARLCECLVAQPQAPLPWKEANAVIRPEMTEEVCRKLYAAGCRVLIIGLESGSQKVLDLMDKGQTIGQMKTVLKAIDRAGLKTRGNFMFGHPGETDEDFQATLAFLKEMHPYIHQVYPSFTLTHLDGRLIRDPQEWGLASGQDPLYWQSGDGANTYPVRLKRFTEFRSLASSLGMMVLDGLEMSVQAYTDFALGGYYESRGMTDRAVDHYRRYLAEDRANQYVLGKVARLTGASA